MRDCLLRLFAASCVCVQVASPTCLRAQETEAIPPWGRVLAEPSPVRAGEPNGEHGENEAAAPEAEASRPLRFWIRTDYLLWYTQNTHVVPLLTRGQTTAQRPGALGADGTKFIYGDNIDFKDRSGARITIGIPFSSCSDFGAEASYFFLTARDIGTQLSSPGNPVLARPFYDVVNNRDDSSLVSYPGVASGTINIHSDSRFQGAEANFTARLWEEESTRITLLAGFRYLNLHEDLNITELVTGDAGAMIFATRTIGIADLFSLDNDFYGGQLGARAEFRFGRFDADILAKVAIGNSHEMSTVAGRTSINTAIPVNANAGLLALSSNSGVFTRNAFAVVPEVGVNLGLKLTERLSMQLGYTFLYWSEVARPCDQIDRGLNPNLIPTSNTFGMPGGPARPAPGIRTSDFYAHGLNLGLTFRY